MCIEPRSHLCPCSQVCPRGRRSAVTAFTHNSSAYHPDHTPADVRAATSAAVHPNRVATAARDMAAGDTCPCLQVCPRGRRSAVTAFTQNSSAYHPDHTRADVRAATSAAVHPNRVATSARDNGDGGRRHFADESSRLTQSMKLTADVSMRFTRRKHVQQQHQDHCTGRHPSHSQMRPDAYEGETSRSADVARDMHA